MLRSRTRESSRGRGINPGASWCDHNKPIMVNATQTGSYYARCLGCLQVGPERPSSNAARQALLASSATSARGEQR
jgi:hypothetical protein